MLVSPNPADLPPDCRKTPWEDGCPAIELSADGLTTLKLVAAKTDLINDLNAMDLGAAKALVSFLQLINTLAPPTPAKPQVSVYLSTLKGYIDNAGAVRDKLVNKIGWVAVRRDLELHYVDLQTQNKENSPEGRLFKALIDSLPSGN
jgi:hypothetical protein